MWEFAFQCYSSLVAALILHFDAVFGSRIKKKNALTLNINTEHAMSSIFIWTKGHVDMHIDYFSLLPQIKNTVCLYLDGQITEISYDF